jgi:hypothetical protein
MVRKKDGTWRPCGDFCCLNFVTTPDAYPLPRMLGFVARVADCKTDHCKGYYQMPVHPVDVAKTDVTTLFVLYELLRMPFGLRNARDSFQPMLDCILAGLDFSFWYLDDITVASSSYQDHFGHLRLLLQWLQQRGLAINLEKSVFAAASVEFLGHEISAAGVKPLCSHVEAILHHPPPFNFKQLQAFLGVVNFYHHFLPAAAGLLRPFTDALRSGFRGHIP